MNIIDHIRNDRMEKVLLKILAAVAVIIGVISSFSTILHDYMPYTLIIIWGIVIIIFSFFVIHQIIRKKINITIDICNITIYNDDVFKKNGVILIPVDAEYTFTFENDKISPNSLHGKFIIEYKDKINQIKSIKGYDAKKLKVGNSTYILFPLCKINSNKAKLSRKDLSVKLLEMWDVLDAFSNGEKIFVPLVGSGHLRVSPTMSEEKNLTLLLDTIEIYGFETNREIDIILYNSKINLNKVRSNNEL